MNLEQKIKGKSNAEKARLKGLEIAKLKKIDKTPRKDFDIQIENIKSTDKGVELYARAWRGTDRVALGKQRVEKEHIIIINPPILVDDENGDIIREEIDINGNPQTRRLKEDLREALLRSIEHTIAVIENDINPLEGSVGETTLTAYPDASSGSTTVDGYVRRNGVNETYATIKAGAGTNSGTTGTAGSFFATQSTTTSNQFQANLRSIFTFDTSDITDGATIDSATFSLYGSSKGNDLNWSAADASLAVVGVSPANNNDIANADYGNFGSTRFATDLAQASISTTGYNDISLNASGLAIISDTGITKLGVRSAADLDTASPGWVSDKYTNVNGVFADTAGTTSDPKLVVNYTAGGTPPPTGYMTTSTKMWG